MRIPHKAHFCLCMEKSATVMLTGWRPFPKYFGRIGYLVPVPISWRDLLPENTYHRWTVKRRDAPAGWRNWFKGVRLCPEQHGIIYPTDMVNHFHGRKLVVAIATAALFCNTAVWNLSMKEVSIALIDVNMEINTGRDDGHISLQRRWKENTDGPLQTLWAVQMR